MMNAYEQAFAYLETNYALSLNPKKTWADEYVKKAFYEFIEGFCLERKPALTQKFDYHHDLFVQPETDDSPVLELLKNSIHFVVESVKSFELQWLNGEKELMYGLNHVLKKLYKYLLAADELIQLQERHPQADFFLKATQYLDHLLEYLIAYDALTAFYQTPAMNSQVRVNALREYEQTALRQGLALNDEQPSSIYFTDSGQQAITSALIGMSLLHKGSGRDGVVRDVDIHLFGNSYFEVSSFLKEDAKKVESLKHSDVIESAKVVFVDVTELEKLPLLKCTAMKALIIDITHCPNYELANLKKYSQWLLQNQIQLVLVNSSLKHE